MTPAGRIKVGNAEAALDLETGKWESADELLGRALSYRESVVAVAMGDAFAAELHEVARLVGGEVVWRAEPIDPDAVY